MTPSLNQFRYFCAVAETGHFGKAAARLNISQPPLSRQIAALEAELGTVLFERTPKGVMLTPSGQQFLADARAVLRLVGQAKRNAAAAGDGEIGTLSVGFTMCAAYSVVPLLTRLYMAAFPRVALHVRELMPPVLERELKDGLLDVGINLPGIASADIRTRALLREPMDVVLPQDHPLARARRLKVEDLAAERFVIVPRAQAAALHDSILRRCQAAGFTPTIAIEVHLQQTIVNFVSEGLGVAFVPASMQRAQVRGAVFKKVADPPMADQVLEWAAANRNPCLAGFLGIAAKALAAKPPAP